MIPTDGGIALDDIEEISDQCCCPICNESYASDKNVPRNLDCGHTHCDLCILKMAVNKQVKCPICQAMTTLRNGKDGLNINYVILGLAEKLIKSRSETKEMCQECNGKFSQTGIRLCMEEKCKLYNKLICLSCAVDEHSGHKLVKYDAKMEKMRDELRVKVSDRVAEMERRKVEVLEKTKQLQRMADALQRRFAVVQIPPNIINQLDKLTSTHDADEYMAIIDDLAGTIKEGCENLAGVLDTAIEAASKNFEDLFDTESPDE